MIPKRLGGTPGLILSPKQPRGVCNGMGGLGLPLEQLLAQECSFTRQKMDLHEGTNSSSWLSGQFVGFAV